MKDFKKTSIVVIVIILILSIILLIINNAKYGVELLTRTNLNASDPTIIVSLGKIKTLTYLRQATFNSSDIEPESQIKFILDNLTESDYTTKTLTPEKIRCEVSPSIVFSAIDSKCDIKIIENEHIKEMQSIYFGTDAIDEFPEMEYHGYICKNDGAKYYCMKNPYQSTILEYSVFANAYQEKDKVVIREYYLRIDLTDKERCKKYLNASYCDNYANEEKPDLETDKIKEDGVLYEHIFRESKNNYYLEQYHIVTE